MEMEKLVLWILFGLGSGGIALVLLGADWAFTTNGRKSVLGVDYGTKGGLALIRWVLGSVCVGFLSQLTFLVQYNPFGMLVVAVAWPGILGQIADTARRLPGGTETRQSDTYEVLEPQAGGD